MYIQFTNLYIIKTPVFKQLLIINLWEILMKISLRVLRWPELWSEIVCILQDRRLDVSSNNNYVLHSE